MKEIYADLHVHLGRTSDGRPVKMAAARDLTFENIMAECAFRKGIELVGVVDAVTPPAQRDIGTMIEAGELWEVKGGGLRYRDRVTVLPGAEVEAVDSRGRPSHWVVFLPGLEELREFSDRLGGHVKNRTLSTQRSDWSPADVCRQALELGALVYPAHAFTPYKSVYGTCTSRLGNLLGEELAARVPALELGLSSNTAMASRVSELDGKTFLSDSDAHSLPKIGREHNLVQAEESNFQEVRMALRGEGGRRVVANYGLDPRLGKYHRTYCLRCERAAEEPPPVYRCPRCGGSEVVMGVRDRLEEIADRPPIDQDPAPDRPPYYHQIPLEFVPGAGQKTLDRLIAAFGSEMAVLHRAEEKDLAEVAGPGIARLILAAREGILALSAGGGGHYGKVSVES